MTEVKTYWDKKGKYQKAYDYFYDKLVPNGIILFDDYGGFEKTGNSIDEFFSNKDGHFLNSPTGQGIFFKLKDSY